MNLVCRNVIDVSNVDEKKNSIAVVPLRYDTARDVPCASSCASAAFPPSLLGFSRVVRSQRTHKNVHDYLQHKQSR